MAGRCMKKNKPEKMISASETGRNLSKAPTRQSRIRLYFPTLFLLGAILVWELILRINQSVPVWNQGALITLLFSAASALFLSAFAYLMGNLPAKLWTGALLLLLSLLYGSQFIYYQIFETYYTAYSAGQGNQVLEFMDIILGAILENLLLVIIILLPLLLFILVNLKRKVILMRSWLLSLATFLIAVSLFVIAVVAINWGSHEPNSAYHSYYVDRYPNFSVAQLGMITTMRLDLQSSFFDSEIEATPPPINSEPSATSQQESSDETTNQNNDPSGTPEPSPTPVPVSQVMEIDFDRLIAEAESDELKQMHEYFNWSEATRQNKYTGMFEGYNLILITAESYSHYALDPVVTPTLYKMANEGFKFNNFYNPVWGVSTSDGEYVATTGLLPKTGVWSMYHSGSKKMPFAMGNQLRGLGYKTLAYHNHTYDYYKRDISHPNLGYEYKGLGNGLDVTETWPESDLEMMQLTVGEYLDHEPFHAYYMTVSGHLRYNFSGNFIARKNKELVQNLPYTESAKAYMATQIELDRAMEYLMNELEKAGVAERTLIVISADHYPYGLEKPDLESLAGHAIENNFELYRSSLIIYAKGMTPVTIDRPVSSLDIIPTVSNLLGLEYDSRLLMGRDAFSDADPLIIFLNRSFITNQGRYNSLTGEWQPEPGSTAGDEYRKAISDEIERKFYYSAKILDYDYYGLIGLE
jgi:phosphoglycerol transferase MdoB-like AlkP superfamily enzyme